MLHCPDDPAAEVRNFLWYSVVSAWGKATIAIGPFVSTCQAVGQRGPFEAPTATVALLQAPTLEYTGRLDTLMRVDCGQPCSIRYGRRNL